MKHSHYFSHWDLWQDYCICCGKYMGGVEDKRTNFGVTCNCFRENKPHGIRRRLCVSCLKQVRKRAENTGDTGMNLINEIERTKTHGQVVWG